MGCADIIKEDSLEEYLKIADIMRILKVSRTTAYEIIHSGLLKSYKVGRLVRVAVEDLQRFIESRPTQTR